MTLIDKNGERQVCDRCHSARVKIRRGSVVCAACSDADARASAAAKIERRRFENESKAMADWTRRYQSELRRIDAGEVTPQCQSCGGLGNRPNFASAIASGKRYLCPGCGLSRGRKVAM